MVPIFICSVFALTIILQKYNYFRSLDAGARLLKERILIQVRENNIKEAILLCDGSLVWAAPVFKAGLVKFGGSRQEIETAMEDAARFEVSRIEKGLAALSTIASVMPLLGLLGTVLGLCGAFHMIQVRAAAMNPVTPADIAGGIWQSLITTALSLVVAIPAFIAYNFFVNRVHGAVRDMEKTGVRLTDLMTRVSDIDVSGKE